MAELIKVVDNRGRTLTPCRRKVAEREVRLNRAKWTGKDSIRLRFDPFAYRYVRLKVLARDQNICYWCGGFGNTMDHVTPWSKGGRTTMNNCICACEECNGQRGDTPPEEFAALRNVPPPQPGSGPTRDPATASFDVAAAVAEAAKPLVVTLPAPIPINRNAIKVAVASREQTRTPAAVSPEGARALGRLLDPYGPATSTYSFR